MPTSKSLIDWLNASYPDFARETIPALCNQECYPNFAFSPFSIRVIDQVRDINPLHITGIETINNHVAAGRTWAEALNHPDCHTEDALNEFDAGHDSFFDNIGSKLWLFAIPGTNQFCISDHDRSTHYGIVAKIGSEMIRCSDHYQPVARKVNVRTVVIDHNAEKAFADINNLIRDRALDISVSVMRHTVAPETLTSGATTHQTELQFHVLDKRLEEAEFESMTSLQFCAYVRLIRNSGQFSIWEKLRSIFSREFRRAKLGLTT